MIIRRAIEANCLEALSSETSRLVGSPLTTRRLIATLPSGGGLNRTVEIQRREVDPSLLIHGGAVLSLAPMYDRVVDNLLRGQGWLPGRVFVTSPEEGDGKTSTAFNLAWSLRKMGKSVLLVELDFARPRFHSVLGNLRFPYGLDSAMRGTVLPPESVFTLGDEGLNIVGVRNATSPANLQKILARLSDFLEWGSEHYEWLILDCPSVNSTEWTHWLNLFTGPALLVVRENKTRVTQMKRAAQQLGERMKGVLLNDFALR